MRLVVGVPYGPQLGCASSDYGVDSRHLHLMTVDLVAVELEGSAGCGLIKRDGGFGLQSLRKATSLGERVGGPELQQIKMIITARTSTVSGVIMFKSHGTERSTGRSPAASPP